MPYAPGVVNNSGQILAQGMLNAANARAGIMGNIGQFIGNLGQDYGQFIGQQKLAAQQKAEQDKEFESKLKALETVITTHQKDLDLTPEGLAQFLNKDPEKTPKQRYMEMAAFLENTITANNIAKVKAEAQKAATPPKTNLMRIEDLQKAYPEDKYDANFEPVAGMPGVVNVKSVSPRSPIREKPITVDIGSAVLVTDEKGNVIKSFPKGSPIPAGYEQVSGGPAQAAPASLPQFMPSGSMLPGAESIPAFTQQSVKTVAPSVVQESGTRLRPIPGGPEAVKEELRLKSEAKSEGQKQQSAQNMLDAISDIRKIGISNKTVGVGSYLSGLRGSDARSVKAAIDTIDANLAFNELRELKESNTSLGQVTRNEMELLKSYRAQLTQELNPEQFDRILTRIENTAKRIQEHISDWNAFKGNAPVGAKTTTQPTESLDWKTKLEQYGFKPKK